MVDTLFEAGVKRSIISREIFLDGASPGHAEVLTLLGPMMTTLTCIHCCRSSAAVPEA